MSKEPTTYEYTSLAKDNLLISAKYRATLLELRVTYACLFMIQNNSYTEKPDGIYVSMKAGELRELIGANSGSFYKSLLPVAQSMTARSLGMVNPENEEFDFISLITEAKYKDSVLTVVFNNKLKKHLVALKMDYTTIPKQYIMKLNSNYAFRLYEILKKSCFYSKSYNGERNGYFLIRLSLAELKLDLGVVNSALDSVQKELRGSKTPNYEKAVQASSEKLYEDWSSFKRSCLDKPIREINQKTDIHVEYETHRAGLGGKVHAVSFTVYVKELDKSNTTETTGLTDQEKFLFHMEVYKLFEQYKLSIDFIQKLSEASDYTLATLKEVEKVLRASNGVANIEGWLLSAVKERYSLHPAQSVNFRQREYDYDELERRMLNRKRT